MLSVKYMSRAVRKASILRVLSGASKLGHKYLSALDISRLMGISCSTHLYEILAEMESDKAVVGVSFSWRGNVKLMTMWCLPENVSDLAEFEGF